MNDLLTLYYELTFPAGFAAARQALYQKGVDNGAFHDSDGPVPIDCVSMWIVSAGDYGFTTSPQIADGVRLYGEY